MTSGGSCRPPRAGTAPPRRRRSPRSAQWRPPTPAPWARRTTAPPRCRAPSAGSPRRGHRGRASDDPTTTGVCARPGRARRRRGRPERGSAERSGRFGHRGRGRPRTRVGGRRCRSRPHSCSARSAAPTRSAWSPVGRRTPAGRGVASWWAVPPRTPVPRGLARLGGTRGPPGSAGGTPRSPAARPPAGWPPAAAATGRARPRLPARQ